MKKLLMGSLVLTALSCAIIVFQMSCTKTANAQASSSNTQLNIILYATDSLGDNTVAAAYWIMNYDGTNVKKIPITFTSGLLYSTSPKLSPDGKTIFFSAIAGAPSYTAYLYSCSVDGSNLKTLLVKNISNGCVVSMIVAGAY